MFTPRKKYHVLLIVIMERLPNDVTIVVVTMEQYVVLLVMGVERFHKQQPVVLVEEIEQFPDKYQNHVITVKEVM
jgi:hypothetical protein